MRRLVRSLGTLGAMAASLLALGTATAQAQATISGRVTSDAGMPLYGSNVTIDAMNISVGTNQDGRYTIVVPAARVSSQFVTLRARAIGFAPQATMIKLENGSQTHDFVLKTDVNKLSQVVVTGVAEGTERTKVPFTVTTVTAADMPVAGVNAFAQIQGKIPGAQITQTSGRPGADPAILLRAPLSINASGRGQGPLIIVDGIIFNGGISDIAPTDIENVEVVKGAAAASLYGSRAGNGVIQITTKRGKGAANDGVRFNVSTEYGLSDIERDYKLAQATTLQMDERYERYCVQIPGVTATPCTWTTTMDAELFRVNDIAADVTLPPRNFFGDFGISSAPSAVQLRHVYQANRFPQTFNPINSMLTRGGFLNSTVSMQGRVGSTNVYASLSNLTQEGAVVSLAGFKRNGIRLNIDQQLGEDWTIAASSFYSRSWQDGANFVAGNNRAWFGLSRTPAFADITRRDSQGRLMPRHNPLIQGNQNYNPLNELAFARQINENDRFLGSMSIKYRPVTWADAEWNFGYDRANGWGEFIRDRGFRTTPNNPTQPQGSFSRSNAFDQSYNTSFNVTMRRELLSGLNGSLSFRYLYEQQDSKGDNLNGNNLAVAGLLTATAVTQNQSISSSQTRLAQMGLFVNGRVDWQGKLIFDGLVRRDGASTFGRANRWQTYGRGSMLYRPSEEKWWFAKDIFNEFKLRAAIGTAGNRPNFSAQYETFTIGTGGTLNPATLGNPNLGPEVVRERDLGIDGELFNRIGFEVSWINTRSENQLLQVPTPSVSGFVNQWRNAGTLENKIFEASINIPIIESWRGITWSTRLNMDTPESRITALSSDVQPYFVSAAGAQGTDQMFRIAANQNYGTMYGRKFVTSCGQLPANFQSRCGDGREWQRNDKGHIVWVGQGNTWQDGITKNLWNAINPGTDAPWSTQNFWGMPIILRDSTGLGQVVELGSAIPSLRWSMGHNISYKRLTTYVLFDAVRGRSVFNLTKHWNYGDFMNGDIDQVDATVGTAKPIGYFWRAGSPDDARGTMGLYDFLGPNSNSVEDASFVKLREVSVNYRIGRLGNYGDWSVALVGRNLFTWSDYSGFDPETGLGGGQNGSGILNAADAFNFPNLRTFTLSFNIGF